MLSQLISDLFKQDRADRAAFMQGRLSDQQLAARDDLRIAQLTRHKATLMHESPESLYQAAMVLQHSARAADTAWGHQLAVKAVENGYGAARFLAAATLDRTLMYQGQPQRYGTQYKKVNGQWILWPCDKKVTDEERARWNVQPLLRSQQQAQQMNLKH